MSDQPAEPAEAPAAAAAAAAAPNAPATDADADAPAAEAAPAVQPEKGEEKEEEGKEPRAVPTEEEGAAAPAPAPVEGKAEESAAASSATALPTATKEDEATSSTPTVVEQPSAPDHGHAPRPHHHHDLQAAAAAARAAKLEGAQRLQEFEAQRCAYFGPQLRSNATHWHAFAATLQRAQAENERVLDFFGKRLAIEQLYCDKLRELPYEDLKGGGGGWRSSGGHHRHGKGGAASSSSSTGKKAAASGPPGGEQPQELAALRAHYRERRVALPAMEELVGSMDALVAKFDEYVLDTRKELVEGRLKPLAGGYKATADQILAEGAQALENVQRAEQHVLTAYAELARAISGLSPPAVPAAATAGGSSSSSGSAGTGEEHGGDLWLADMQYRVAVELQKRVWATAQAQLGALFGRMKALELNRRQQLHALILRFMQNQGGFWGQLPQLAADSALRISGLAPSDPQEVESALAEEIRTGARAAEEKEKEHDQKYGKKAGAAAATASIPPQSPAPSTPSSEPFTGMLRSPLDTPLVKKAEVLEHKLVTGMEAMPLLKRWRPTLAVLTVDNVLHLFDLPPTATGGSGGAPAATAAAAAAALTPKEAFRSLVPPPLDNKGRVRKGKEAERVRPTASLVLDRSKARFRPEEGDGAFDITESTANVGLVKVFKSHETKRVTLRARSQAHMVDWCVIVNGEEHAA